MIGRGTGFLAVVGLLLGLVAIVLPAENAAGIINSVTVTRLSSGTSPNAASTCPTQVPNSATHCAGLDTSIAADDQILRTNDTADVKFEVAASVDTLITLTSTLPSYAVWNALPASCGAGSTGNGTSTLTCKLPNATGSQVYSITATIKLLSGAGNGNTFTVPARVTSALSPLGVTGTSTATFTSSAKPSWNVNDFPIENINPGPFYYRSPTSEPGVAIVQGAAIVANQTNAPGSKGLSKLAQPVTYTWSLASIPAAIRSQARLLNWGQYGNGCGNDSSASATVNPGYTNVGVRLSNQNGYPTPGTYTCTQPGGPGTDINVSMTGITDTGTFYAGWMVLWFPLSALPPGLTNINTGVQNFDPTDTDGVSNEGGTGNDDCTGTANKTGCEPLTDNYKIHSINNADISSLTKNTSLTTANPYSFAGGSTGTTVVDRGATYVSSVQHSNTGTQAESNLQVCDKFDPSTQYLTDWSVNPPSGLSVPAGTYAVVTTSGPKADPILVPGYAPATAYNNTNNFAVDPNSYIVEYAAGDWASPAGAPATAATINNAGCGDADPPTGWRTDFNDPAITAYAASKGLTAADVVNRIRVTFKQPVIPGEQVTVKTRLKVRSTYRDATVKAGQTIIATTPVLSAAGNLYDGDTNGWAPIAASSLSITGTVGVLTGIGKTTSAATLQAGLAGSDTATFTLSPSIALGEDITDPQPLRVIDLLPPELHYIVGSASRAPDVVDDRGTTGTLLVWDLGPQSGAAGTTVRPTPITYRAVVDPLTPAGTATRNNVVVQSVAADGTAVDTRPLGINGCGGNRTLTVPPTPYVPVSTSTVMPLFSTSDIGCFQQGWWYRFTAVNETIGNALVLAISKFSPLTRIQPGDTRFDWSIKYVNLSSSALPGVDLIDVLPYNGDGRGSTIAGTIKLNGIPTTTDTLSGTVNPLPVSSTIPGPRVGTTFYYSSAAPASINRDPYDATNLALGSTKWCLAIEFGLPGCPANAAAATAVRVISGQLNASGDFETVTLPILLANNENGTVYSNDASARAIGVAALAGVPVNTITVEAGSISGTVWRDTNGDGVINNSETGRLAGVPVTLRGTDDQGNAISKDTVTGTDGKWTFTALRASNAAGYRITVGPGGLTAADTFTKDPDGPTAAPDGTFIVNLPAYGNPAGQDVGVSTQQVTGRVYVDTNDNGAIDSGETGIAGVTVALTGTDDKGAAVNLTTTSTSTGTYAFANVRPGTYTITETQPTVPPYVDGRETPGTGGGTAGAAGTSVITGVQVKPGLSALDNLFGELLPPVIRGLVYRDVNLNGVYDAGDLPIPGVTITLSGTASKTITTQDDGTYAFTDLAPGTYTLTETQPAGYVDGTIAAGTKGGTVGTNTITNIPIVGGDNATGYTFGERIPPPGVPILTGPSGLTKNSTPTITGTGSPGSTVRLYDGTGTTPICTTTVGTDGSFSCTPTTPLSDGPHSITAIATGSDGQTSGRSTPLSITVDTTAPASPTITGPAAGSTVDTGTPIITGGGEPGATVTVREGSTVLGTATVGTDGTWSLTPVKALIDGRHTISATQTDPAGNTSPPSANRSFTVDTTAPEAPAITAPATGAVTNDNTPTLSGTGEPGSTVTLFDGTKQVGQAVVASDGTWSITTPPLADAEHTFTATQTDAAGLTSPASSPVVITIDTVAPVAPTITGPKDGSTTADTTPTITGTGEPGSTVTIRDANTVFGTATVDTDGTWSFTPTAPISDGVYVLSGTEKDKAGNVSELGNSVTFTVNSTTPPAPVITAPAPGSFLDDPIPVITGTGEPGDLVTIRDGTTLLGTARVDANGKWSFTPASPLADGSHSLTATQANAAGTVGPVSNTDTFTVDTEDPAAPTISTPAQGADVNDSTPTITGTGEPGATVTVYDGTTKLGTTTVGADGTWTFTPTTALTDGSHTLSATQTDKAGNTSPASAGRDITVDTGIPAAPTFTGPPTGTTTSDTTPTFTGKGEPGATVTVRDGTRELGTATVADDGTWTFTPTTPLGEGAHSITATQTDKAGNVSPTSAPPLAITVDSSTPPAPVITSPAPGSSTNDATPTLSGTAQPNDTITVYDGTTKLGTATVDSNGNWTFTPTTGLSDGQHTFTVTQTNAAGTVSDPSPPVTITVDTKAPAAPAITSPATGAITKDVTPPVGGTGEPGATVTLYDGTTPIGTATVGADGKWSITPDVALTDGSHTLTTTQTDVAGNVSPTSSPPVTITVDSTSPDAPELTGPEDGSATSDNTPTFTGTGEAGATVTVTDELGNVVATGTVGSDGTFSITPPTGISDGPHTFTPTQTDKAGNTSDPGTPITVLIDTMTPAAPEITSPAPGAVLADNTPTITGTGEPNTTVLVFDGTTELGLATVAGDGTWSLTPVDPLSDGPHRFTAVIEDRAGNRSDPSPAVDVTIDTKEPDAPTITGPADGASLADNTPTITGKAEPGSAVTVYDGTTKLGTATAGSDGSWTFTPVAALADGAHTLTATATDKAGNVSNPSTPVKVTVDTLDPLAPAITAPSEGDVVDTTTPTITGTGEPGSNVTITDTDGTVVASGLIGPDGVFSLIPSAPLSQGSHTLTATVKDAAGNTSPPSTPVSFTVDTVAPAAPSIVAPASGTSLNNSTPTISGRGEPGATVTVYDGATKLGTATVRDDGSWSFTTPALSDGPHTFTATQTDGAGNVSDPSDPVTVTIDTAKPAAPSITSPVSGADLADNTPTLTGKGEPGGLVTIYDGTTPIGTADVDADGNWTFTPAAPLGDGPHSLTATVTDPAGNVSDPSTPVNVTVDTAKPSAPSITSPAPGDALGDNTPATTGKGEPGGTVTIYDGTTPIGTATVGTDGTWTFTPATPLSDGPHTLTATVTDKAGNVSDPSTPVAVTVDTKAPAAPSITSPAPGADLKDSTPAITGKGEPGGTVTIYDGTDPIGTATVGPDGTWTFTPTTPLGDGPHSLTSTVTDKAGNVSDPSDPVQVTVDTAKPDAPAITAPAPGDDVNDSTPTIIGKGEPGGTVTIYDGTTPIGTAPVDADGNWTFTPTTPLGDGPHTLITTVTDKAGNVSDQSTPLSFTVDTKPPAAPTISSPAPRSSVNDSTPTLRGRGEPGDTVTVYDGTTPLGTTTVGTDGTWSFTPTTPLGDGPHPITATQTDPAGNTSPPSTADTITVDTATPTAPSITSPASGADLNDNTPTIGGTGEPGDTITIYDGTTPIGTTTVGPDGTWTFTPATPLGDGPHSITATGTDPAGNVSDPSTPVTVNVDTVAPPTPVIGSPPNGTILNESSPNPPITGTGQPGDTITITDGDGNVICTTTVAADGTFSCTPATPLPPGLNHLTITETDPAGNVSAGATLDLIKRPAHDLAVTSTVAPARITVGQTSTITVTVENKGPDGEAAVTVQDPIGGAVKYSRSTTTQGTYDPATGKWTVGNLGVGQTAKLTIVVVGAKPGSAKVPFTVAGTVAETYTANDTTGVTIVVIAPPASANVTPAGSGSGSSSGGGGPNGNDGDTGDLADTGVHIVEGGLLTGLALLVLGFGISLAVRRRRREH